MDKKKKKSSETREEAIARMANSQRATSRKLFSLPPTKVRESKRVYVRNPKHKSLTEE